MKFSPNNFLYMLKQLVTGSNKAAATGGVPGSDGGFNLDYVVDLGDVVLGTGTTYTSTANVPILSSAAGSTTVGLISWPVNRDYDQASDKLIVRIIAKSAGATNSPTITVAASTSALGGTVGVAASSITSAATTASTAVYEFDFSNLGLVRDTIFSALITLGAHGTDAFQIFAIELVYASCVVSYVDGVDALNNPLR